MIALGVAKLKMFSLESEIFFGIKPKKKKKKLFCGKFGSMPTFRSKRKGKKCFFLMSLRLSDHKVLHNIASSSRFFLFRSDFLAFFARISYFRFLEFKEFNKTIIHACWI